MKKSSVFFLILFLFVSSVFFAQVVKNQTDFSNLKYLRPDFKPVELYSVFRNGKRYMRVKVKNNGFSFKGRLAFRIEYLGPKLSGRIIVSKQYSIASGKTIIAELIQMPTHIECGEWVRVTVDPFNKISETNETNNVIKDRIFKHNVGDGKINAVGIQNKAKIVYYNSRPKILRIYPFDIRRRQGPTVSIPFRVEVQNCGKQVINGAYVKIYYSYESKCKSSSTFIYLGKSAAFSNYQSEVREAHVVVTLPLLIRGNNGKYCDIDKLYIKAYYQTREPNQLTRDNQMIVRIIYTHPPQDYR